MASQADVRIIDNAILEAYEGGTGTAVDTSDSGLSWWDRLKESVVPESYGESVVNAIYSTPGNTLRADPVYDRNDLSSPNVYVQAKGAAKELASAAGAFGGKILIVLAVLALLAIAVHAGVTAYVRR